MPRQSPISIFKQSLKSDSYIADEIVNIYLLRPIAAGIVWILYPTRLTPNHVTLVAILFGLASAVVFSIATPFAIGVAGILVLVKDILDDADGQLARAKQKYSRRGRFLDSIGDFIVDVAVFGAIIYVVYSESHAFSDILIGIFSLVGITLRVSYHVFYQVSFFHLEDDYKLNRVSEEITESDKLGDPVALNLQKIFIWIYGWQDKLMYRIDVWCRGSNLNQQLLPSWYSDKFALRLSGFIGFGTEFTILAICSWWNELRFYLYLNVFLMNAVLLMNIFYRRFILASNLR